MSLLGVVLTVLVVLVLIAGLAYAARWVVESLRDVKRPGRPDGAVRASLM